MYIPIGGILPLYRGKKCNNHLHYDKNVHYTPEGDNISSDQMQLK